MTENTTAARPNILWFVSEDCSPNGGALGDGLAKTPTIDRLAAEGVVYDNMFSIYPVCAPARFAILTGAYPQSFAPSQQMRSLPPLPEGMAIYPEVLRSAGYYTTNNAKTDYNCAVDPQAIWDECGEEAHWSHGPDDRPFLAVFNSDGTHESAIFHEPIGPVSPDQVRVPAYLPDTPAIRGDLARYYTAVENMDTDFARRLAEVERAGRLGDTMVFYSSDHGGVGPWTKRHCHDQGLRVPLVIWAPPGWQHLLPALPGTRLAEPVTHVDITATLIATAGAAVPDTVSGRPLLGPATAASKYAFGARDRMDERYDLVRTVRDRRYRYLRNYLPHRPAGQHQAYAWQAAGYQSWEEELRAGRLNEKQRRFFEPRRFEELYDTVADPDHNNNLADEPSHRPRLDRLRAALDDFILDIGDLGFAPEGSPVERQRPADPHTYPLAQVMELAATAARRNPAALPALVRALSDTREVMRFWAAQGLLMLGTRARPAAADLRRTALEDTSPHVRIPAAEALTHIGHAHHGVRVLGKLSEPEQHPRVRLQALNALTYVGDAARAVLPVVDAAANQEADQYLRNAGRYLQLVLQDEYTPASPIFAGTSTPR